jgi:hypothetical protein
MRAIKARGKRWKIFFPLAIFSSIAVSCVEAQQSSQASIIANVTAKDMRRICNLGPNNFSITLDGKPVRVSAVRDEAPRSIILVLDASSSITGLRSKWDALIEIAQDFISSAPQDCALGFVLFGTHIIHEAGLSEDREKILDALNDIGNKYPEKKRVQITAFYDALQRAVDLLSPVHPGDAIYALSDADDNASKTSINSFKAALMQKQIRLFLLLPGERPPDYGNGLESQLIFDNERGIQAPLARISLDSAGTSFKLYPVRSRYESYRRSPSEMTAIYQNLRAMYGLIFGFYRLDLDASPPEKKAKVKMKIMDHNGQRLKDVKLYYSPRFSN